MAPVVQVAHQPMAFVVLWGGWGVLGVPSKVGGGSRSLVHVVLRCVCVVVIFGRFCW